MKLLILSTTLLLTLSPGLRAALLVYESFDYGATAGSLDGKGGSQTGLQGTWTDNSSSAGTLSAFANYRPAGLTFSDLAVQGGRAEMLTTTSNGNATAGASRQLNLLSAPGDTLYGSYLFRKDADAGLASVVSLLIGGAANINDNGAKFSVANNEFGTANAGGRISGTSVTLTGTSLALDTTYLYAYKLTGLGTVSQSFTGWVLTAAQYDSIKSDGITEAELNGNNTETGSLTKAGNLGVSATDYLRMFSFYNNNNGSTQTQYDELRISNTSFNEVITAVPEPSVPAILGLSVLTVLGFSRSHRRCAQTGARLS